MEAPSNLLKMIVYLLDHKSGSSYKFLFQTNNNGNKQLAEFMWNNWGKNMTTTAVTKIPGEVPFEATNYTRIKGNFLVIACI